MKTNKQRYLLANKRSKAIRLADGKKNMKTKSKFNGITSIPVSGEKMEEISKVIQQSRENESFIREINDFCAKAHENSKNHGFYDNPGEINVAEKIALMHSELSEALEGYRKGNNPDEHCPEFSTLEVELSDVIIRVADFAAAFNLRLGEAIIAKHEYNQSRPYKHGKKF